MLRFDKKLLFYQLPPVVYASLIIYFSSIPLPPAPDLGISWSDKIYHFAEYVFLGLLVFRAFPKAYGSSRRKLYYCLFVVSAIVYSVLDETVQYFVPGRDASVSDTVADILGFTIGGLIYAYYQYRRSTTSG